MTGPGPLRGTSNRPAGRVRTRRPPRARHWGSGSRLDRRRRVGRGGAVPAAPAAPTASPPATARTLDRRFRRLVARGRRPAGAGRGPVLRRAGRARALRRRRPLRRPRGPGRRRNAPGRSPAAASARAALPPFTTVAVPSRRRRLRLQDLVPVEGQAGIRRLDVANRLGVERGRPTSMSGGVRNQYSTRMRAMPSSRNVWQR